MPDYEPLCRADAPRVDTQGPLEDPLLAGLWEQDVLGNQFLQDQLCADPAVDVCWAGPPLAMSLGHLAPPAAACGPGAATAATGISRSEQLGLDSVRTKLNDPTLSPSERAAAMLAYRNQQLALVDLGAMQTMQGNDPSWPLYGSGADKGLAMPLYEKLGQDPDMQALMNDLADRIIASDADQLDIYQIFGDTQAKAGALAGPQGDAADANLAALQAMATLMNYYKIEQDPNGAPILPLGVDPALWAKIEQAGNALTDSKSPRSAVMSHGLQAGPEAGKNFAADNNFHFFSHAYLTASLIHEHGVQPHQAEAMSGFIGAQYELMPASLREGSGNSGLKDILMNAEGAAFGADLMAAPETCLPGLYDGPLPEDRSFAWLRKLDPETRAVADAAGDLSMSGLLWSALQGANTNKVEMDLEIMRQTGLPPAPSGAY